MIISGESSGELYGALLALTLKERNPGVSIIGVGGERMQSAGVELISRISSAFGLSEAVRAFKEIRKTYRRVTAALASFRPQVLVLIDYPDFNLRVARAAKKSGIKVLYYVSPQVWAWRKNRVRTIGMLVGKMGVILPFEEKIYRDAAIPCEFVGHPAVDEIRKVAADLGCGLSDLDQQAPCGNLKAKARAALGLAPDRPVMVLMPGSRPHEVEKLLPVMSDVLREMQRRYPDMQFVVPVAPNLDESLFPGHMLPDACRCVRGQAVKALLAADLALIASGTSTLQAALVKVPMLVIYKVSLLTYVLGKLIIRVKHMSLANLLLDRSAASDSGLRVRELLQGEVDTKTILEELSRLMDDGAYRSDMISQLDAVGKLFLQKEASLRMSEIAEELAEGRTR